MKNSFAKADYKTGLGYAYIHFATEVMCFYYLFYVMKASGYWVIFTMVYDILAFAPQAAVGAFCEKHPKFRPDLLGGALLICGAGMGCAAKSIYAAEAAAAAAGMTGAVSAAAGMSQAVVGGVQGIYAVLTVVGLVLLCLGNVFVHIAGALTTLAVSEGRLSESAIFVGGGSFGLITGKLLASSQCTPAIPFLIMLSAMVLMLFVDRRNPHESFGLHPCRQDLVKESFILKDSGLGSVIVLMAVVVAVRAYIGYGIPTIWNDTAVKGVILYCVMGLGKALGGILSDAFGARRVGILSCLLSVPFLLLGSRIMMVSLVGVALFSMTMAITLGALVSIMKDNPGIAFGVTTLGLLTGSLPVILLPMPQGWTMYVIIAVMSVLSAVIFAYVLKKEPCKR